MKVCTVTHRVDGFGEIPAGSLWDDDSPYAVGFDRFADCTGFDSQPPPVPRKAPVRKFAAKPVEVEGDDAA